MDGDALERGVHLVERVEPRRGGDDCEPTDAKEGGEKSVANPKGAKGPHKCQAPTMTVISGTRATCTCRWRSESRDDSPPSPRQHDGTAGRTQSPRSRF